MNQLKVAVIGAGVSGLSAAWLLAAKYDVTLFEADERLGGHANTVYADTPDAGRIPIDTGFIVYNTACYPNLIALFDRLKVPTAETDMSFAVSLEGGGYEYSGSGLGGLFGQASNILSPAHWLLTREIFRFFREANAVDASRLDPDMTLGEWLAQGKYSKRFIHAHIVPMGAAIWSTPADEMLAFPFAAFARFFANHGLLQTFNRPAWRTVRGGSREYVTRLIADFEGRIAKGERVVSVVSGAKSVTVTTASGAPQTFSAAILACHADEALKIIERPDQASQSFLSSFRFAANEAILHTDAGQMPRRKRLWSSWNYIGDAEEGEGFGSHRLSASYWMNKLQPLATKTDYFVTLNPVTAIRESAIVRRFSYRHPMFDVAALRAQAKLPQMQGRNCLWFAGAYLGYGFHEDGVQSGLAAAEHLSLQLGGVGGRVERPWTWDKSQSRIATTPGEVGVTLEQVR